MKTGIITKWGEYLGEPECPYLRRWFVALPSGRSLRLHHFYGPDDTRHLHDHPWWYVTLVLRHGYADVHQIVKLDNPGKGGFDTVMASRWLKPGHVYFREADRPHCVMPGPKGVWTLVLTGAKTRKWGFWVDGNFVGVRKFFRDIGHPPCPAEDEGTFRSMRGTVSHDDGLEDDTGKNRRP